METQFKKVYFKKALCSYINDEGQEKKSFVPGILPPGYQNDDFDYTPPWIN
jgi:hypothetical protein